MPTIASNSAARSRRSARLISGRCALSTSVSCVPIRYTGFSEFIALWKTTAISDHRTGAAAARSAASRSITLRLAACSGRTR